jgi:hypothetical protein
MIDSGEDSFQQQGQSSEIERMKGEKVGCIADLS